MFKKSNRGMILPVAQVVITIMGLLVSMTLVSLGSARSKARDAKRQSDVRQISLAQEMLYDDGKGYTVTTINSDGRIDINNIGNYLMPIPTDPGGGRNECNDINGGHYCGIDNTKDSYKYCIFTQLENNGKYFVASNRGTYTTDTAPVSLDECN